MSQDDPLPQLSLNLSQGTIDAILRETGSLVAITQDAEVDGAEVPAAFESNVDEAEAQRSHQIAHSFRIETESFHVLPDHGVPGFGRLETASQSVLDSVLGETSTKETRKVPAPNKQGTLLIPPPQPTANARLTRPLRAVRIRSQAQTRMGDLVRQDTKPIAAPSAPAISDFPSNTPYPGKYEFEIFFSKAQESESKKTISYIYSVEEAKLYVRMRVHCPVHFKTSGEPPIGSSIRAMVIYSRPQDVGDVVRRCMNHTMEDKDSVANPDHLVRCHNPRGVEYSSTGPSQRHSVAFPWDPPPPGSAHITGIYEFMCFSSCSGTINRRPTQMIFTLESNGEILGRQVIELRICACPGRDIVLSESGPLLAGLNADRKRKGRQPTPLNFGSGEDGGLSALTTNLTSIEPLGKKHRDNEIYTIQVRGRELYKIVMTIVRNYEISRRYEELAPLFKHMKDLQALTGGALGGGGGDGEATEGLFPNNTQTLGAQSDRLSESPSGPVSQVSCLRGLLPEQLAPDTSVYDWLVSHELEEYAPNFTNHGFHTLEDLENTLSMEMLERMEMPSPDRDRLFGALIQYKSMRQQSQLSGLSSGSLSGLSQFSLSGLSQLDGASGGVKSEGFRIAKTKVTSMYKMQKRRPPFPMD